MKSGRPHNLPLNDTAFQKLQELHQKTGSYPYVFVHLEGRFEGQAITDIKNAFNAAVARAKIKNFRFHDLRQTFCSWLAIRGVPLTAIQKLAGHASIKMTLRYAHLSPRYLADEVKALDRFQQDGKPKEGPTSENVSSSGDEQGAAEESFGMDEAAPTTNIEDGSSTTRAQPKVVKAGNARQAMHGIGKK